MRPGERLALAVLLGATVVVGGAAAAATYAWHTGGTIRLAIHESGPDGANVSVRIPGVLVNAAVAVCPMPRLDLDADVGGALRAAVPALRAVAEELAEMPDAVLVDIHEGPSTVRIAKSGAELVILIRQPGQSVDVAVPIAAVRTIAARLAGAVAAREAV